MLSYLLQMKLVTTLKKKFNNIPMKERACRKKSKTSETLHGHLSTQRVPYVYFPSALGTSLKYF